MRIIVIDSFDGAEKYYLLTMPYRQIYNDDDNLGLYEQPLNLSVEGNIKGYNPPSKGMVVQLL